MAKRFIDTELFSDSWFMDLSKDCKIGWLYFITNCNHAGILELNKRLFEFQTGVKWETVSKGLSNRLITVKEGFYFMPKFIEFQYPNWPNSKVRQQQSAIEILTQFGINTETLNKPLVKGYDNDTVNDTVIVNVSDIDKREQNFKNEILKYQNEYSLQMLEKFFLYWSEPNKSRTKMRFEQQATWDLSRRLKRWKSNNFDKDEKDTTQKIFEAGEKLKQKLNGTR